MALALKRENTLYLGEKLVGKILDKRYVILESVGPDGQGMRYLVYDIVSLKRIHVRVDPDDKGELSGEKFTLVDGEAPSSSAAIAPPKASPAPPAIPVAVSQASSTEAALTPFHVPSSPAAKSATMMLLDSLRSTSSVAGAKPSSLPVGAPIPIGKKIEPTSSNFNGRDHTQEVDLSSAEEVVSSTTTAASGLPVLPPPPPPAPVSAESGGLPPPPIAELPVLAPQITAPESTLPKTIEAEVQHQQHPVAMPPTVPPSVGLPPGIPVGGQLPLGVERPRVQTKVLEAAWFAHGAQQYEEVTVNPEDVHIEPPTLTHVELVSQARKLSSDEYRKFNLELSGGATPKPVMVSPLAPGANHGQSALSPSAMMGVKPMEMSSSAAASIPPSAPVQEITEPTHIAPPGAPALVPPPIVSMSAGTKEMTVPATPMSISAEISPPGGQAATANVAGWSMPAPGQPQTIPASPLAAAEAHHWPSSAKALMGDFTKEMFRLHKRTNPKNFFHYLKVKSREEPLMFFSITIGMVVIIALLGYAIFGGSTNEQKSTTNQPKSITASTTPTPKPVVQETPKVPAPSPGKPIVEKKGIATDDEEPAPEEKASAPKTTIAEKKKPVAPASVETKKAGKSKGAAAAKEQKINALLTQAKQALKARNYRKAHELAFAVLKIQPKNQQALKIKAKAERRGR